MKKVLIIDDNPDFIAYVSSILAENNYRVCSAKNAEEGLEKVKIEKPDLILLDLKMRRISGVSFFKEIKEKNIPIPIIIITGALPEAVKLKDFLEVVNVSPDAYLEKDIDPVKFIATVEKILSYRSNPRVHGYF